MAEACFLFEQDYLLIFEVTLVFFLRSSLEILYFVPNLVPDGYYALLTVHAGIL